MDIKEVTKFNEAVNQYYKLKNKYESSIQKNILKIMKDTTLSKPAKHEKFKQLKNKCVICGKDGGTIFIQENNILIAKCGNLVKPCALDIQLQKARYISITDRIMELNKIINKNKVETISSKLNFLFKFNSESETIEYFTKLKEELVQEVKQYQKIYEQYNNIIYNLLNTQEILERKNELLIYNKNLSELIKNYEETEDIIFLKESVELYIHNIKHTAEQLQSLEYKYSFVEHNEDKHILVQENYTQSQLQIPIDNVKNKILVFKK